MPDNLNSPSFRAEFPALSQVVGTKSASLYYLDSAATSLKPRQVIEAVFNFYAMHGGSAGRGSHSLATYADGVVEETRAKVLRFTGASSSKYTAIFTSGATESLNLLASTIEIKPGQNIVLTRSEHHANIVPWQARAKAITGVEIRYLNVSETGEINFKELDALVDESTAVLSFTHASNVTGIVSDLSWVSSLRKKNPYVIIVLDACQSVAHLPLQLDVADIDFCAFSAHKMYGPSGLGILVGRNSLLEQLPPYQTGGGIVEYVGDDSTTYMAPPTRFEPGSINAANIAGLAAAIDFIDNVGWASILEHEKALTERLFELENIEGLNVLGTSKKRLGLVSFTVEGIHPHDLGQFLDEQGLELRTGHHCAQLLHRRFGVPSSTRASLGVYSNASEIEHLIESVVAAKRFFRV